MSLNGTALLAPVPYTYDPEEEEMADAHALQRVFDKVDAVHASVATTQADVARIQGTQRGIEMAIDTVKTAIGDVNETKLEARETKVRMESLEKDMSELKQAIEKSDTWARVETLVKWAVGGLTAGGGLAGALKLLGGV